MQRRDLRDDESNRIDIRSQRMSDDSDPKNHASMSNTIIIPPDCRLEILINLLFTSFRVAIRIKFESNGFESDSIHESFRKWRLAICDL